MKKHIPFIIFTLVLGFSSFAQVGIGNTNPKASLDVSASNPASPSNTDGVLIPRIDNFPTTDPTAAQQGMMVYLTTTSGSNPPGFYYWDNTSATWISVIGSTVKKINDLSDGKSDNDGTEDGSSIFLGVNAGSNDDESNNANIGIGKYALRTNNSGSLNVAIGFQSMSFNTSGTNNTALGYQSMLDNTTGDFNTAIGTYALYNNTTANFNTSLGHSSLMQNLTGQFNIAVGNNSLYTNTTGSSNLAIGFGAGYSSTGNGNLFLGYQAGYNETGSHKLYIENSNANEDNALIYGDFNTNILRTNSEFQIGNPTGTGYAFPTADGTSNQVIRTDGNGNLSWVTPTPNTDNQQVDLFALSGTTLGISLQNDGVPPVTVDLSSIGNDNDWTTVGADIERQSGDVYIGDTFNTNNDLYISNNIIDWDNTSYFLNPNNTSKVDEIEFDSGSASDPSIRFSSTGTGFFSPIANTIAYSANGIEAFRISGAGKIGIGTINPNTLYNLTSVSGIANHLINIGPTNTIDPLINISSSGDGTKGINVSLTSGNLSTDKNIVVGSLLGYGFSTYLGYFQSSSNKLYGLYNSSTGTLPFIGLNNSSSGTLSNSAFTNMGIYNYVTTTGSGNFTGMENRVNSSLSGTIKGVYNYFTSNSSGIQYGVHTVMNSPDIGAKYGTYIDIAASAGGTHYGIYSDVQKSTGYAGYFIGRMSLGNTSSNRYLMPASDGAANQVITTDGAGNLSWVTPPANTDNQQVDLFALSGTTLGISLQNDGVPPVTVDLSSLQDGTGTDDQNISGSGLSGTTLTIGIENGSSETVDLSSLQDADWYESGGTPPNNINDNIYTQGNVAIGTTNAAFRLDIADSQSSNYVARINNTSANADADGLVIRLATSSNPTSNNYFIAFNTGIGANNGSIRGNGTGGVNYATTSDRRLKTQIVSIENALDLIEKIQPRKYEYKANLGKKEYGFIAQELQSVYPQAVSGDPKGNVVTDPMMVDYSRLTPILTAGIKELKTEVETLKEENKKLKEQLKKYEDLEKRIKQLENNKQ